MGALPRNQKESKHFQSSKHSKGVERFRSPESPAHKPSSNGAAHSQHFSQPRSDTKENNEELPTKESLQEHSTSYEKRIKRHWYPTVLLVVFLNCTLLASCFYIIYSADEYATNKQLFLGLACTIIFVPLIPISILLFSPWPRKLMEQRSVFSERDPSSRWKNIINIIAALASFTITICYLVFSAIPAYNTPIWENGVEFLEQVPVPAVAFVIQHTDRNGREQPINYTLVQGLEAFSVTYTGFDIQFTTDTPGGVYLEVIEQPYLGKFTAIVANNTAISAEVSTPMGTGIGVTIFLTYNSTKASPVAGYIPQIIYAIFDARIPVAGILECGLVQPPAISAFTDNTLLLSMTQITDRHRIISPALDAPPFCEDIYQNVFSDENRPLTLFNTALTSSSPSVENFREDCDIATNSTTVCRSSMTMVYGSQFVQKQRSVPGRSKQSIWIDIGAIVGAIQFFTWLILIFFHG